MVPKGYLGITIFPFVIIKYRSLKSNITFINHEQIHIRQQLELLILPFFIWYFIEFLIKFWRYKNWSLAYRNVSFEREAYQNERAVDYLQNRPLWSFVSFL